MSDLEEDVPPCLFAHKGKAQNITIESLGLFKVVSVDASLDDGLDEFHGGGFSARVELKRNVFERAREAASVAAGRTTKKLLEYTLLLGATLTRRLSVLPLARVRIQDNCVTIARSRGRKPLVATFNATSQAGCTHCHWEMGSHSPSLQSNKHSAVRTAVNPS